jgi:polyribonucleotide nucleotidyltransferase
MGLITDGNDYLILTDVQGPEDHHGDMDLKVTGTVLGITALQMDIKVASVPLAVVVQGIADARKAHTTLLECVHSAVDVRGTEPKKSVPRIENVAIPEEKVGLIIGTHGKTVKGIEESTGAAIHIRNGSAEILGTGEAVIAAKERILQILDGGERSTT